MVGFAVFGHVWSALRFLKIFGKDINVPGRPGCWTCDFYGSVVLTSMLDADANDCASILRICPQVRRKLDAS